MTPINKLSLLFLVSLVIILYTFGVVTAIKFTGSSLETIKEGGQACTLAMSQSSSVSNSSYSRHLMCKDYDLYYNPIEPTTIFMPSDTKAVCLTTVSIKDRIEFRWYYRSNSSKTWVSAYNWSQPAIFPGEYYEYHYGGHLFIAGYWPAAYYPRAYKVVVYLDGSLSFSEFFEVTNGGLHSPRLSEDVDVNGQPVNIKSRFTIGVDTKAQHSVGFSKMAYYNERMGYCHNFTTVWIQPNGSVYRTYSSGFDDYKDTNTTWNYWEYRYNRYDYISINSSTPVGNWRVEVYLNSYYFNNTWVRYGPIATTLFVIGSEPVSDWTFMIYLDGDTSVLEPAAIEIFLKMAHVGSSSQVNIVVQMDRIPGQDSRYGNWTDCKRFIITKGMTPTPGNATLHLGELNMGHPNTLKNFVNWTMKNCPANYYFLVLWDHGTGAMGLCFDVTDSEDFLSLPELSQALSGLPAMIDVVFSDACAMSMPEMAYQLKDCANVLVGPEGLGYSPAAYDDYLSTLTSDSSLSPTAYAKQVVEKYIRWCNSILEIQNATISAIDLTKMASLRAAIDDFALKMKEKETLYHPQISLARNLTKGYQGPYAGQVGYYIDLYHFVELTHQYVRDEEFRNAAADLMAVLEDIVIRKADKACPNSHSLSIFFPDEKDKFDSYESVYEETGFAKDTPWDELVRHHLSGYLLMIQTPYSDIPVDIDDESYTTDENGKLRVYVLPGSYTIKVPTNVSTETEPCLFGIFEQWIDGGDTSNPQTINIDNDLAVEAKYKYQYYLTIKIDPGDLAPQPIIDPSGPWYDEESAVQCDAQEISGYTFEYWILDGIRQPTGLNPLAVTMNKPHNATVHYVLQPPWWETLLRPDITQVTLGLVGIALIVALVVPAWFRTRRKRGIIRTFLKEIDEVFSRFKKDPKKCEEELSKLRNTILEGLTDGKISEESYNLIDKRIDKYKKELQGIMEARAKPVAIEVSEVLPGRITAGYGDLDNLLFGGIPENYAVILTSPSCDEKDLLIKRFLEAGAKEGQITFYVTTETGGVGALAEEFQSNFYLFLCNPQADKIIKSLPNVFKLKGVENLTEISIALTKAFRGLDESITGPRRACIEIVSGVLLQHHTVQTRRLLTELISEFKLRGFTIVAVMNPQMHPSEEVHAILDLFEGEINIYEKESEKGLERFMKIKKMYNQRYLEREMPLKKEKLKSERSRTKSKQK